MIQTPHNAALAPRTNGANGESTGTPSQVLSDRARRRRRTFAWMIVSLTISILALGWLLPDIGDDGAVVGRVNWLSFVIRTFTLHGGVVLMLLALPIAIARAWRPAVVLSLLGVLCIVPLLGVTLRSQVPSNAGSPAFRVMTVNVMYGRVRDAELLAELDRHHPDVLVIQEYTPEFHTRLRDELTTRFPHNHFVPRDDAFGMALYSRLPFAQEPTPYPVFATPAGQFQPSEPQIRAIVTVDEREVVIQGVHTLPPISATYLAEQRRLCRGLAELARRERRPLVLAGDFNHTPASMPARWLRGAGLEDVHAVGDIGRGLTWPASGGVWSIAGFRLDQILYSEGLIAGWSRVGGETGSDHRPVVARLGFR